jgi:hypothetical protein
VIVVPNKASAAKHPSAWCRSARCRKSAMISFDPSSQSWIA